MAGNVSPESANLFACVCVFVRMLDPITAGSVSSDLNELKMWSWRCQPRLEVLKQRGYGAKKVKALHSWYELHLL